MKNRLLFFSIFLFAAIVINAQITITSADAPSEGMIKYMGNDSVPSALVTQGSAGTNQTWNLSALNLIYYDTMRFVLPSATPYASQFPGTNLAVKFWLNGSQAYYFINKDNSGVYGKGAYGNLNLTLNHVIAVHFTPSMSIMRTPSAYSSNYTENYHYSVQSLPPASLAGIVDSIKIHSWIIGVSNVDGWGSITTPGGTFNVIRQFLRETNKDTIWVKTFLGWQQYATSKDTADTYKWLANGIGVSIAEMKMNRVANKAKSVTWYVPAPTSVEQLTNKSILNIYPNPASDFVYINNLDESSEYTVKIYDIPGKEVRSLHISNVIKTEISFEGLKNGVYFVTVLNSERKLTTEKIIINR